MMMWYRAWLMYQAEFWFDKPTKAYLSKQWEQRTYPSITPNERLK